MRAIELQAFGGPEVMEVVDRPDPVPAANEVLIDVTAIGVNFADTHVTSNDYLAPQTLPLIPGGEVVGTLADGRRVLAAVSNGGYAQRVAANAATVYDIPDGVSDEQALCLLVQGLTAWHTLATLGHLKPGETVVIHAAAGGVGTLAMQLAKMWGGFVIAVASGEAKAELARSLGADVVIDSDPEGLRERMLAANGGRRIDIVLEMVGGSTFDASLAALAPFGRVITYGMASREMATPVNPALLCKGSKTVAGFWLAHCFGNPALLNEPLAELFALVASGAITPVIGETFALTDARAAHIAMRARQTTGKVVLDPAR